MLKMKGAEVKSKQSEAPKIARTGLRQQVLLAALDCSNGDLNSTFTAEELLLAAWKRDPMAWGLRGHEKEHPDSEKIYVELDRASRTQCPRRSCWVGIVGKSSPAHVPPYPRRLGRG
jgi:hypothetical protein